MKLDINVLMKGAVVDIPEYEIKSIFNNRFKTLTLNESLDLVRKKYLESKGLAAESIPGEKIGAWWETYENNGSHYSGYYDTNVITTLEDIEVMNALSTLRTLFL